ncbi:MAG: DUF433 domain-containing protein [Caldilineaceae bacterium]
MTQLLEKAIQEMNQLSAERQDAIATLVLEELADERWQQKSANEPTNGQPTIVRTERGLTIAGTRITLYQIMEALKANQSPETIRDLFRLTLHQMADVIAYIEAHRADVEAEYQYVLKLAEEHRLYWEERNRQRFEQISKIPSKPEDAVLWSKLQAWKTRLAEEKSSS